VCDSLIGRHRDIWLKAYQLIISRDWSATAQTLLGRLTMTNTEREWRAVRLTSMSRRFTFGRQQRETCEMKKNPGDGTKTKTTCYKNKRVTGKTRKHFSLFFSFLFFSFLFFFCLQSLVLKGGSLSCVCRAKELQEDIDLKQNTYANIPG
jgi:hypothetical protein